ncbi:hypothetical protein S40288_02474 [Stachybotrys chartarum IBT 40288]|nr:hypothetical protein S40288_02474 [Stachybotrys chartarum IBT 40288]
MSSSVKATKKSAFSCEPCRRRKVKCGGEQPICKRCAARKDDCVYRLNPTLSYTQRLEERIKELEDQLANKAPGSHPDSSQSSPLGLSPHDILPPARSTPDEKAVNRGFRGLKIDDNGAITYHGATSFFNLPSEHATLSGDPSASTDSDVQRRERLVNNAWQQRALENLSEIPEPYNHLLKVHWCWIQPLFNFIYRPAFTRDMQRLGPYYSHTLMNAIFSHSIRWAKSDPAIEHMLNESFNGGTVFGEHARRMLFEELGQGTCTIPTIQTLLLLSAQECSFGNSTQAWTYSGLAFRLMDHLGICLDGQRYPESLSLSDEDVEIRHRIFWSCYLWDKIISLYLGRSPSLTHSNATPPQIMFDDSSENEMWVPFGTPPVGVSWNYPPTTAHSASCFWSMCRLTVIFNEILIHMYDPLLQNTEFEVQACLRTQAVALQRWWDELPPYLKIEPAALPALAPPSHIVTMNCLYHTFKILLYRPMLTRWGSSGEIDSELHHHYLVECVTSATATLAIFDLFRRTFGMRYCVLSLAYSVYTAASVYLLQVQAASTDQQAIRRLSFCVQMLTHLKTISPIIGKGLSLVHRELAALGFSLEEVPQPITQPSVHNTVPGMSNISNTNPTYSPIGDMPLPHAPYVTSGLYESTMPQNFGAEPIAIDPNVYQAMSSLEPLSVNVATIHEADVPPSNG